MPAPRETIQICSVVHMFFTYVYCMNLYTFKRSKSSPNYTNYVPSKLSEYVNDVWSRPAPGRGGPVPEHSDPGEDLHEDHINSSCRRLLPAAGRRKEGVNPLKNQPREPCFP